MSRPATLTLPWLVLLAGCGNGAMAGPLDAGADASADPHAPAVGRPALARPAGARGAARGSEYPDDPGGMPVGHAPAGGRGEVSPARTVVPARPTDCVEVAPGSSLQAAIEGAPPGGSLCLGPGLYPGPLVVSRPLTLWGPARAVVRNSVPGTIIDLAAPGARLLGLTVDGEGGRYDKFDAAVRIRADGVVVEGVEILHATYGILAEGTRRITVRGNVVHGDRRDATGLRGDGIRLWETSDSTVEDNLVEDGRDVVVWYSSGNQIRRNTVQRGRYGTHFMYSHRNVVEDNRYLHGVVGVFIMYSREVTLRGNVMGGSAGAAGLGIGLKDSGNIRMEGNLLIRNRTGLFVDNSPSQQRDVVAIEGNVFRLCDVALGFHGGSGRGSRVRHNDFVDNGQLLDVDGGGDAMAAIWESNHYDEYAGYDLDRNGVGDVPFELRRLSNQLAGDRPSLRLLEGTPALFLVDAVAQLLPLYEPRRMMLDAHPQMRPHVARESLRAR